MFSCLAPRVYRSVRPRGHLQSVIDVTIGYEGEDPSLYDLILGKVKRLHLHIKRFPMHTLPNTDKELEEWIIKCFYDKDLRLKIPKTFSLASYEKIYALKSLSVYSSVINYEYKNKSAIMPAEQLNMTGSKDHGPAYQVCLRCGCSEPNRIIEPPAAILEFLFRHRCCARTPCDHFHAGLDERREKNLIRALGAEAELVSKDAGGF